MTECLNKIIELGEIKCVIFRTRAQFALMKVSFRPQIMLKCASQCLYREQIPHHSCNVRLRNSEYFDKVCRALTQQLTYFNQQQNRYSRKAMNAKVSREKS